MYGREHIWNDVNKDMRYLKCILALPSMPRATQQKTPDKLSTNDKTQQIKHMRVVYIAKNKVELDCNE
jgi:hypothetical protein